MRTSVLGRIVPLVLAVVGAQSLAAAPASAVSGTDYDSFGAVTLNDVTTAGAEIPYAGGAREFASAAFDTATFTLQPEEVASGGGLHGCLTATAGAVYAGRTAWVRFNPGADGHLRVVAETAGYDSVLAVRSAGESGWQNTRISQLGSPAACADLTSGPGDEVVADVPVSADRVYFVQVGGRCSGAPTTCQDAATPGGSTLVRLTFTPQDGDADGVPDRQDNCEGQGVAGRVTVDGCPDADVDGIADSADSCPTTSGVPAEAPYNGCPAGPRPPQPSNNPFLRIESSDEDDTNRAYSTSSRHVELHLNWPQGATKAVIRNIDGKPKVRSVGTVINWRLPVTKRPREREVRVHFRGPDVPDLRVGDTILFDQADPEVEDSLVLDSAQGWYVGLDLADRGTGISSLTLLDEEQNPIPDQTEVFCTPDADDVEVVCEEDEDLALSVPLREPVYVEVADATGNTTLVELEKAAHCLGEESESILYKDSLTRRKCVTLDEPCRYLKPLLRWKRSTMRCRRVDDGTLQVVAAR